MQNDNNSDFHTYRETQKIGVRVLSPIIGHQGVT